MEQSMSHLFFSASFKLHKLTEELTFIHTFYNQTTALPVGKHGLEDLFQTPTMEQLQKPATETTFLSTQLLCLDLTQHGS